ncbi:hypothetical protein LC55x_1753 [Lysobacter capsici]|nr:hypothetical protein LC55x_1753 [Lysobacter capsici]
MWGDAGSAGFASARFAQGVRADAANNQAFGGHDLARIACMLSSRPTPRPRPAAAL